MINEITLASVLADLRDEYKVKPGDFARGYARGVDRAINLLMMWQYRPDSKPEAIPRGLMGGIAGVENRPTAEDGSDA